MIYNFSGKGTKKNAQTQKKEQKVYFYAIFVVFRLRGVAVASRWDCREAMSVPSKVQPCHST